MARRLEPLTLANLDELPVPCRNCVFWELDPVAAKQADRTGDTGLEKEAWLSQLLLDWGTAGVVLYVDDEPAGYAVYAPAAYLPRIQAFPTAPVSPDAVVLATGRILPRYLGLGLGKILVQAVAKDVIKRGFRAVEAFGDSRWDGPSCVWPTISCAPSASASYGNTLATRACGWTCGPPSHGAVRWKPRWSG